MKIPKFLCLYDVVDGGAGGGAEGAPTGNAGGSPSGGDGGGAKAYDLSDESLIRVGGQKEPVQFGKWYKGLQGQLTKASQERADFERRFGQSEATVKELRSQYENLIKQVQGAQSTGNREDALKAIRDLQYLSGADAAQIVEAVQGQLHGVNQQFGERDKAIIFLGQKLAEIQKQMAGHSSKAAEADFSKKIDGFLEAGGYDPSLKELAAELYSAYEGEDLDQEFPGILKSRVEQVMRAAKAAEAKAQAKRRDGMFVPGKGGTGTPSAALRQKLGKGSPKSFAGDIWDMLVSDDQASKRT